MQLLVKNTSNRNIGRAGFVFPRQSESLVNVYTRSAAREISSCVGLTVKEQSEAKMQTRSGEEIIEGTPRALSSEAAANAQPALNDPLHPKPGEVGAAMTHPDKIRQLLKFTRPQLIEMAMAAGVEVQNRHTDEEIAELYAGKVMERAGGITGDYDDDNKSEDEELRLATIESAKRSRRTVENMAVGKDTPESGLPGVKGRERRSRIVGVGEPHPSELKANQVPDSTAELDAAKDDYLEDDGSHGENMDTSDEMPGAEEKDGFAQGNPAELLAEQHKQPEDVKDVEEYGQNITKKNKKDE